MSGKLKTLFFGENSECAEAERLLMSLPEERKAGYDCRNVSSHDDFRRVLLEWRPCLIIVLANGAAGMEGVFSAKNDHPESTVFWFSDDHAFGMMSHRLDCEYFAVKPVTLEKYRRAFQRCAHVGVEF